MAFPLFSVYLTAVMGNCTILSIVRDDHSLHISMSYFLSMLAMADLGLSVSMLPTVLSIFWFDSTTINF